MENESRGWPPRRAALRASLGVADAMEAFQRAMTLAQLIFVDDTRFAIRRSGILSGADLEEAMEYAGIAEVHSGRDQHASILAVTAAMRAAGESVLGPVRELAYDAGQLALAGALGEARGRAIGVMGAAWERFESEAEALAGLGGFTASLAGRGMDPAEPLALAPELARALGGHPSLHLGLLEEARRAGRAAGEADMAARGSRLA
jgi:hypothetical protein